MFSLFKTQPLISDPSAQWIVDTFEWALEHFDAKAFFHSTQLILPTNEFFPGAVASIHEKAENIFNHCRKYAGLNHWPFQLQRPEQFMAVSPPLLPIERMDRQSGELVLAEGASGEFLNLTYHPQQVMKAEDLAASFVHGMAQHLVIQSRQMPPGGPDYFTEATEILAIMMGFGLLVANSAYTFRGGCGSCYNALANRKAALSEDEVIFAYALFCRLKNLSNKTATSHLKNYLKPMYKQAIKQLDSFQPQLQRMATYQ